MLGSMIDNDARTGMPQEGHFLTRKCHNRSCQELIGRNGRLQLAALAVRSRGG